MSRHLKHRSGVTNGTRTHIREVGQTEVARRYRDLLEQAERERGGKEAMPIHTQTAARLWAGHAVAAELIIGRIAAGETLSAEELEAFGRIGDRMDRQAGRMGPAKVSPRDTLQQRHTAAREGRTR